PRPGSRDGLARREPTPSRRRRKRLHRAAGQRGVARAGPAMKTKKRILVTCPTTWDEEFLSSSALRERYEFHFVGAELMADEPPLLEALAFEPLKFVEAAVERYRGRGISAVTGEGDYPGCMLAAMVAERMGLPTPPAAEVVRLSHKLYSRQTQELAAPEATPLFEALDPDAPRPSLRF